MKIRLDNYFYYNSAVATVSILLITAVLFFIHEGFLYYWEIFYSLGFWIATEIILFLKNIERIKENDSQ